MKQVLFAALLVPTVFAMGCDSSLEGGQTSDGSADSRSRVDGASGQSDTEPEPSDAAADAVDQAVDQTVDAVEAFDAAEPGKPSITGLSGSIQHRSELTVQGRRFGLKPTAAPLRHDSFEGGTVGERLDAEAEGGWYTFSYANRTFAHYDDALVRYPGTQSANQSGASNYIGLKQFGTTQRIYVSGWFNLEAGGAPSRNVKIINMGARGGWQSRIDTYPHTGGSGTMYAYSNCAGDQDGRTQTWTTRYAKVAVPDNKWHRIESYLDQGTAAGGGYRDVWVDGVRIGQINGTFVDGTCEMTYVYLGHYFSGSPTEFDSSKSGADCGQFTEGAVVKSLGESKYYTCLSTGFFNEVGSSSHPNPVWSKRFWDEIYVDTTQARVEIGNASTWAECTHKEIQTPLAWAPDSISVRANLGSFEAGQQLYLYVVDAEGNVNNWGFPIIR